MITDRTAGGESEGGAEEVASSLGYKGGYGAVGEDGGEESMETEGRKWYGEGGEAFSCVRRWIWDTVT